MRYLSTHFAQKYRENTKEVAIYKNITWAVVYCRGDIACWVNYRWNQRIKKQTFSSGFRTSVVRPSEFPRLPSWGEGVL